MYRPINTALVSWIFDGELLDKSLEFFIACDESAKEDKLWRSKYSIRHSMLPSFISEDLAENKVCYVLLCQPPGGEFLVKCCRGSEGDLIYTALLIPRF